MVDELEVDDKPLDTSMNNWNVLWYFFNGHQSRAFTLVFLMLAASLLESLNIVAIYPIINYGLNIAQANEALNWMNHLVNLLPFGTSFMNACVFLILVTLVAVSVKVFYQHYSNKLTMDIVAKTQKDIFHKLATAAYAHYVKNQQGKMVYAASVAFVSISNSIYLAIRSIQTAITIVFLVGIMIFAAWQGMMFMIGLCVFYVVFVRKILKKFVNRYSHLSVQEDQSKNVILNEYITGIKSIKAFHVEDHWEDKFAHAVDRSAFYRFKVLFGNILPDSFLKFVFFSGIGLAGIFLGNFYKGEIVQLLPIMGTFSIVAMRLIPYVNMLGNDTVAIARCMPDVKIIYNFLHETLTEEKDGDIVLKELKGGIQFENVWFKYDGTEEHLFSGINFHIKQGEMTAIVGPSGSGKTSIVNLLLGLYQPLKGRITLGGTDIKDLKKKEFFKEIGYVSQETFIFNGTIKENILFGGKGYTDQDIIEAAKLANAHEFITKAEQGYDTVVGDSGAKLSGGQRQRIAIARAMLRKPHILLMDEATSSLDTVSERQVQEAINNIAGKTTILIIAHRLSTVQNANKIIVLQRGQIVEEGTHAQLSQSGKVYSQLYKTMSPLEKVTE